MISEANVMEWQQLKGFHFAAKEGNFTKAAKLTFRTQSALSQQIKSLEQEFGCLLFDRKAPRRITLTPEGERFFKFSKILLTEFNQLKEDIYEMHGQPRGSLKFVAPFTTLMRLFPEILTAFTKKYPYVELKVLDRPQEEAIRLVQQGEADFCVALKPTIPKILKSIPWKKVTFVLMVPPKHPLTKLKLLTLNQIVKYPLIVPPLDLLLPAGKKFFDSLKKNSKDFQVVMESSNVELSSIYVEEGLGISFASVVEGMEVLKNRKLKFIPLENFFKPDQLSLVMRHRDNFLGYKKGFIDAFFGSTT
jgi:DNA-binding transcriptional LysR family regulator